MDHETRQALTSALSTLSQEIAADLQARILAPGPARVAAEALHVDEQVGDSFEVWSDLLSRRAAVLWVLKSYSFRIHETPRSRMTFCSHGVPVALRLV